MMLGLLPGKNAQKYGYLQNALWVMFQRLRQVIALQEKCKDRIFILHGKTFINPGKDPGIYAGRFPSPAP
jgi:hypothetical protein